MLVAFKSLAIFVLLVIFCFVLVFIYGIFQCLKDSCGEKWEDEEYYNKDENEDYD